MALLYVKLDLSIAVVLAKLKKINLSSQKSLSENNYFYLDILG
jgi:hypothetical protein